jgi:hypothetical protein
LTQTTVAEEGKQQRLKTGVSVFFLNSWRGMIFKKWKFKRQRQTSDWQKHQAGLAAPQWKSQRRSELGTATQRHDPRPLKQKSLIQLVFTTRQSQDTACQEEVRSDGEPLNLMVMAACHSNAWMAGKFVAST